MRVSGSPDPDKVKVYGPGIDHGVLAMYQSRFICDTRGAGAGQLTVRIRGPKGNPNGLASHAVGIPMELTIHFFQAHFGWKCNGNHKKIEPFSVSMNPLNLETTELRSSGVEKTFLDHLSW